MKDQKRDIGRGGGNDLPDPTALTDCPYANFTAINVWTFLEKMNTGRCVSGHVLDGRPNPSSGGSARASLVKGQRCDSVLRKEFRQSKSSPATWRRHQLGRRRLTPVRAWKQNDGGMRTLCQGQY